MGRVCCRRRYGGGAIGLICLSVLFFGFAILPAAASVPDGDVLEFAILRNGDEIGRHVFRFRREGDTLAVDIEARIDYRFGFIPLYWFDHRATEIWRDGRLSRLTATTRDNGENYEIELRPDGPSMRLSVNGEEVAIEREIIPASLWNVETVKRRRIVDPADGEVMDVTIADAGPESVPVRGRDVAARHYIMTGDFDRELWYDADGVLVQVRFRADDGSEIRYDLR